MPNNPESKTLFTVVGFRSPYPDGRLRTIELCGVPGQRLRNGEHVVSDKMQRFFDDLLVGKLFRLSNRLHDCDFKSLKIWLYDTETKKDEIGYEVPSLDDRDLEIRSKMHSSKLERIYVLDNELTGREYDRWEKTAQELFTPLFMEFIAPPEPPEIIANLPIFQMVQEAIGENLDRYGKMKQKLFFNALIVQVD